MKIQLPTPRMILSTVVKENEETEKLYRERFSIALEEGKKSAYKEQIFHKLEQFHGDEEAMFMDFSKSSGLDIPWGYHVKELLSSLPPDGEMPEQVVNHLQCKNCPGGDRVRKTCTLFRISCEGDKEKKMALFEAIWDELWHEFREFPEVLGLKEEECKDHLREVIRSVGVASTIEIPGWFGKVTDVSVIKKGMEQLKEKAEGMEGMQEKLMGVFLQLPDEMQEAILDGLPEGVRHSFLSKMKEMADDPGLCSECDKILTCPKEKAVKARKELNLLH